MVSCGEYRGMQSLFALMCLGRRLEDLYLLPIASLEVQTARNALLEPSQASEI